MKCLAAVFTLLTALIGPALAGAGYTLENRAVIVFPGTGHERVSPYPMSKRAASVWHSDGCFRNCSGQSAWRFEYCIRELGPEVCRIRLDADDRICLRTCRTKGGPLLNITD
jgi:hypothetical protein